MNCLASLSEWNWRSDWQFQLTLIAELFIHKSLGNESEWSLLVEEKSLEVLSTQEVSMRILGQKDLCTTLISSHFGRLESMTFRSISNTGANYDVTSLEPLLSQSEVAVFILLLSYAHSALSRQPFQSTWIPFSVIFTFIHHKSVANTDSIKFYSISFYFRFFRLLKVCKLD